MGNYPKRSVWRKNRLSLITLACLGCLLAGAAIPQPVEAQVLYGSLVGNVKDPSHAAVPGTTVTITNQLTNASRETITTDERVHCFATVQNATYPMKV